MIAGLGEVLIGYRVDRDVGPLVLLAAGGVLTEIHARPQPAARAGRSCDRARDDRRGARRSRRSPAIAAGPRAISMRWRARSSRCRSLRTDPAVAEAEINPLIVHAEGHGVVAVDALVRLA